MIYFLLLIALVVCNAQKIVPISSLKGADFDNVIDATPPFAIYVSALYDDVETLQNVFVKTETAIVSLDALRNRKQKGSGRLQPYAINATLHITSSLSDAELSALSGFLYITTAKQLADQSFLVFDVDQAQNIKVDRTIIGDSTLVFLNTYILSNPLQSTTISSWTQSSDGTAFLYRDIPSDDAEDEGTQLFSNPIKTVVNGYIYIPNVEKFALSMRTFYIKTHNGVSFSISPQFSNVDGRQTTDYWTTGFYMKPKNQPVQNVTVRCLRDTNYNGTTGANVIGNITANDGMLLIGEGPDHLVTIHPSPVKLNGWDNNDIRETFSIYATNAEAGEYFVQYYILQDQLISKTQTTPSSLQSTTKSSGSLRFFASLVLIALTL